MCLSGLWCPPPICLELAPQSCDEGQWQVLEGTSLPVTVFLLTRTAASAAAVAAAAASLPKAAMGKASATQPSTN